MSADNILVILHNRGNIRVYEVNFSWVSSFTEWSFPMTRENSSFITRAIVASPNEREIHKCETVSQAEGFCLRYQRENVVEYDFGSIIPQPSDEEIQISKKKKRAKGKS